MRTARILLILGIWVAILPYLGFSYLYKDILTAVSGIGLIFVSYTLYREFKTRGVKEGRKFENFSENTGFKEEKIEVKTEEEKIEEEKIQS